MVAKSATGLFDANHYSKSELNIHGKLEERQKGINKYSML
jgi:hypothetical protein